MYRMTVVKSGEGEAREPMMDMIRGSEFYFETVLQEGAEISRLAQADLLLLDLRHQPQRGLTLLRDLRLAGEPVEAIAYLARGDRETLNCAMRLGVADCLIDPFDRTRFEQAVGRFLRRLQIYDRPVLTQEMADSVKKGIVDAPMLPKGLQQKTLETIRAVLAREPDTHFTCGELVKKVRVSRITVQRYLAYLSAIGELEQTQDDCTGGRPCTVYRYRENVFG